MNAEPVVGQKIGSRLHGKTSSYQHRQQHEISESQQSKVRLKITLLSNPNLPYRVISAPVAAPINAIFKFVTNSFAIPFSSTAIITSDGFGINPNETAGNVFLKYGADLCLIPRDRVG